MAIRSWSLGVAVLAVGLPGWLLAQSASGGAHPDFSGLYFPGGGRGQTPSQLPYNDTAKKLLAEYEAHFTLDDDPGRYCIWPGMPRAIWGAPFTVEINQRPQDISIYWEGYGMYRRSTWPITTRRRPYCRRPWAIRSRIGKATPS